MMMAGSTGQYLSVPPGFRFHPTEEELLSYYLRKKVSYEDIDLDVIREVDINRLEPWDIKERCRVGSGPQNEWYFFSHKDKKYPTGSRTNRATHAGFWKATGRDKVILRGNSSRRIGTRKTLVFYTGRAPNGQKTDWIMHEYRLHEDHQEVKEEGWVVCRVFQKKNLHQHSFASDSCLNEEESQQQWRPIAPVAAAAAALQQRHQLQLPCTFFSGINSVHRLPPLLSPDAALAPYLPPFNLRIEADGSECYQNPMKATAPADGGALRHERQLLDVGDPTILDRLLESHQNLDQIFKGKYCNIIAEQITPQILTGGSSGLAPTTLLPLH